MHIELCMYSRGELVYAPTRGLFWCTFPELGSNEGNKHQNNTRVSTETVRHESTYIILFLTRHNDSINDAKNEDLHTSCRVSLARFMFCWWRHNRLAMTSQWPDNCDAITWMVISNELGVDFIHGDIHDRSCKKVWYFIQVWVPFLSKYCKFQDFQSWLDWTFCQSSTIPQSWLQISYL